MNTYPLIDSAAAKLNEQRLARFKRKQVVRVANSKQKFPLQIIKAA